MDAAWFSPDPSSRVIDVGEGLSCATIGSCTSADPCVVAIENAISRAWVTAAICSCTFRTSGFHCIHASGYPNGSNSKPTSVTRPDVVIFTGTKLIAFGSHQSLPVVRRGRESVRRGKIQDLQC